VENEFTKVMSERTNEELIRIVTVEKEGYNPTAIEAANSEIKKRNIDSSGFEKIKTEAVIEKERKQKIDMDLVSSGVRFVNHLIDSIVWAILTFVMIFIIGFFFQPTDEVVITLITFTIIFGTFIGYYAIMEIMFQKTVGKYVTKTQVVKMNGEKPNNGDILTRTFCRLIPFDRISFLFVKNGIHDFLSKTKVIKNSGSNE